MRYPVLRTNTNTRTRTHTRAHARAQVLNKRQASNQQVRLAIAHALAQSVKLSLYEERVWDLVEETRELPGGL